MIYESITQFLDLHIISFIEQTSVGSQWSRVRIVVQSGPDDAPLLFRGRDDPALEFADLDLSRRL
jgi:hypothetical protein